MAKSYDTMADRVVLARDRIRDVAHESSPLASAGSASIMRAFAQREVLRARFGYRRSRVHRVESGQATRGRRARYRRGGGFLVGALGKLGGVWGGYRDRRPGGGFGGAGEDWAV